MGEIIPFARGTKLPSYLKKVEVDVSELTAGASGGGFPFLSIKGKVFTLVEGGERTLITAPDDPEEPATSLEVVVVAANKALSKIYYETEFEEGAAEAPDCFSNDGIKPDPAASDKQAKLCADCEHNVWGSGKAGRGKRCSDSRRVAIVPAGDLANAMLLRVPPASLKPLADYAAKIAERGLPYNAVVTKLRFESAESSPKLKFQPVGFLEEDDFTAVQALRDEDIVKQILGQMAIPRSEDKPDEPEEEEKEEKEEKPKPQRKKRTAKKAPAKKAEPKPEPKPEPEPEPEPEELDEEEDLDSLLAGFED